MARVGSQCHRTKNVLIGNDIVFMKMLSFVLRVGYISRVFENRMLRKIAGCKLHDVRKGCMKLYKGEFRDLYFWTKYYGDQINRSNKLADL
jgi:hypothetical protein